MSYHQIAGLSDIGSALLSIAKAANIAADAATTAANAYAKKAEQPVININVNRDAQIGTQLANGIAAKVSDLLNKQEQNRPQDRR